MLVGNTRQDAGSLALRGFAYQALSQLGERIPSVLSQDLEIPERLFEMLAVEAPGVRASLQQSLATLSVAYAGVEGDSTYSLDTVYQICNRTFDIRHSLHILHARSSSHPESVRWTIVVPQP